jgi:hypothetical protein
LFLSQRDARPEELRFSNEIESEAQTMKLKVFVIMSTFLRRDSIAMIIRGWPPVAKRDKDCHISLK